MTRCRRAWRAVLTTLVGAGALSGCYYDAYAGYWRPCPWYYGYPWGCPYGYYGYYPNYAHPQAPPNPGPGFPPPGAAAPQNGPVQRAPLPPPA
jgi:hypothetical protein